jgi:hypothetical protein
VKKYGDRSESVRVYKRTSEYMKRGSILYYLALLKAHVFRTKYHVMAYLHRAYRHNQVSNQSIQATPTRTLDILNRRVGNVDIFLNI